VLLEDAAEFRAGELGSSRATMTVEDCEAAIVAATAEIFMHHKPVFLLATVLGLADADAVAWVADGLIGAMLHWLSPQVGDVASHLGRHRREYRHIRSDHLLLLLRLHVVDVDSWSDRQLKRVTRGLRDWLLPLAVLLVGAARRSWLHEGREQARHRVLEAWLEAEALAGLGLTLADLLSEASAHVPTCSRCLRVGEGLNLLGLFEGGNVE